VATSVFNTLNHFSSCFSNYLQASHPLLAILKDPLGGRTAVAAKVNLDPRARNPGLREKYLLALHSKIRQAGSSASEVVPSGSVANKENKREVASYAQALRRTRGK
jgi:hypothetical protein